MTQTPRLTTPLHALLYNTKEHMLSKKKKNKNKRKKKHLLICRRSTIRALGWLLFYMFEYVLNFHGKTKQFFRKETKNIFSDRHGIPHR